MERIFFGHPKAWDDDKINEFAAGIKAEISRDIGQDVAVIPGRDDFNENIASEGNFNGWCRSVTRRSDAMGRRWYDVIVLPKTDRIGKATAAIAIDAFDVGIPVVEVEEIDGIYYPRAVVSIDTIDDEDFIGGWKVVTLEGELIN